MDGTVPGLFTCLSICPRSGPSAGPATHAPATAPPSLQFGPPPPPAALPDQANACQLVFRLPPLGFSRRFSTPQQETSSENITPPCPADDPEGASHCLKNSFQMPISGLQGLARPVASLPLAPCQALLCARCRPRRLSLSSSGYFSMAGYACMCYPFCMDYFLPPTWENDEF